MFIYFNNMKCAFVSLIIMYFGLNNFFYKYFIRISYILFDYFEFIFPVDNQCSMASFEMAEWILVMLFSKLLNQKNLFLFLITFNFNVSFKTIYFANDFAFEIFHFIFSSKNQFSIFPIKFNVHKNTGKDTIKKN